MGIRVFRRRASDVLNALSSKKAVKYTMYLAAIVLFFVLILFPPIIGIFIKWGSLQQVVNQPSLMNRALVAVGNSFSVGLLVAALDVLAGIPMAWFITRGKSRWLSVLDTLADMPFIVPTAALGYSLLLFWNGPQGFLRSSVVRWFPLVGCSSCYSFHVLVSRCGQGFGGRVA